MFSYWHRVGLNNPDAHHRLSKFGFCSEVQIHKVVSESNFGLNYVFQVPIRARNQEGLVNLFLNISFLSYINLSISLSIYVYIWLNVTVMGEVGDHSTLCFIL